MKNRHSCSIQKVFIKGDRCRATRGGTPTVRTPIYKLQVVNDPSDNLDKPVDIVIR